MTNPLDDDGASNHKETEEARAILAALELELAPKRISSWKPRQ